MTDFAAIRKWSTEQMLGRLRLLREMLEGDDVQGDDRLVFLDEIAVILLEVLAIALKDMKAEETAYELFVGVYEPEEAPILKEVVERFKTTREYVERFKQGDKTMRARLRPILVSRGMI